MYDPQPFLTAVEACLSRRQILLKPAQRKPFQTGIRVGGGEALAVLCPESLVSMWRALKVCVEHDVIVIVQAANTGVTAGSTPYGNDYDRPVVIISVRALTQTILLNDASEVIALPGATLYELEERLMPFQREPHSVIGSSCIGASIVGGICNNSGGSLVNRGPAYTQLSLYAQLDSDRQLRLVNEMGLDLGEDPEAILTALDEGRIPKTVAGQSSRHGSDVEYQYRVRNYEADTPARFNADPRRLYKASGCAGKLAVFAVRLDTFPKAQVSRVFYLGTSKPECFNRVRRQVLSDFKTLPELGEYMHASYFDVADQYCKDLFLIIKRFGSKHIGRLWAANAKINAFFDGLKIFPDKFAERFAMAAAARLPDHLPVRVRAFRKRFDHHLAIKAVDGNIAELNALLAKIAAENPAEFDFFECDEREAEDVLLHRFVAGNGVTRYAMMNKHKVAGIAPLDIALRRNDQQWMELPPPPISEKLATPLILSHFFCNVFHLDLVVKSGFDTEQVKQEFLEYLDQRGAKYPAEHNVGHYYEAEPEHKAFYQSLDPCNSFNAGVGRMSKRRDYQ